MRFKHIDKMTEAEKLRLRSYNLIRKDWMPTEIEVEGYQMLIENLLLNRFPTRIDIFNKTIRAYKDVLFSALKAEAACLIDLLSTKEKVIRKDDAPIGVRMRVVILNRERFLEVFEKDDEIDVMDEGWEIARKESGQ
jgi:hypothetical protein